MSQENIVKVGERLLITFWIAAPFILIVLNYKEMWMWTPFGKIEHNSMLLSNILASFSWLFVFYLLPFVLLWILKPIFKKKPETD